MVRLVRLLALASAFLIFLPTPGDSQNAPPAGLSSVVIQDGGWGSASRSRSGNDIVFTGNEGTATVTSAGLQEALRWSNVTVASTGDIVVNANISWNSRYRLTLSARRNIVVPAGMTIMNGGAGSLILHADNVGQRSGVVMLSGSVDFSMSTGLVNIMSSDVLNARRSAQSPYAASLRTNGAIRDQIVIAGTAVVRSAGQFSQASGDRRIAAGPTLALEPVVSNLSNPVALASARDGSMRLFIVDQSGVIRIFNGTQVLATPFLSITSKVLFVSGQERGLLGLAFDPSYTSNGFFYVYYTSQPSGDITIARYSVTADPNVANPNSELILKTHAHPTFANHNGGSLVFGPDGCLYAGVGDGGGSGDPNNNGQNLTTLLGKIIRISPTDGAPCAAAPGNPFVSAPPGAHAEIWALGVRNPWRITFDRQTGDLFIADVGQGTREEVNFQTPGVAGRNYWWRNKEGTFVFDSSVACSDGTPTVPILEYDHSSGNCSITGGYRYRGIRFPGFVGTYFYGDYCSGRIWGATQSAGVWSTTELLDTALNISSFGEDDNGEVYVAHVASTTGAVYRLIVGGPPALQVGPATGLIFASGSTGGPFSPGSFDFQINASASAVDYSISGVPSGLTVTSTGGTATISPATVTFNIAPAAQSLSAGIYTATIAFTNTTSGVGTQTRDAVLYVSAPNKICTQEVKICPSGAAVQRLGPSCEFAPCP